MPEPTPSAAAVATAKTLCVCQLCARTTTEWPVHVVPCRRLAIARALDAERAKAWEEAEKVSDDMFARWDKAISKGSGVSRKDVIFYREVLAADLRERAAEVRR